MERVLSIKTRYLAEQLNYEVHVVTLNQGDMPLFYDFSKLIKHHDIKTSGKNLKYFFSYRQGLQKVVSKVQPEIILVCDDGLKGFFIPRIISNSCPMIYERHASINISINKDYLNLFDRAKFRLQKYLMHFGAKKYKAFVVLTNQNTKEWTLKNLKVIPNPLSFYPKTQSNLNNKKVITVGNHGFQKGYDRLLKSWKTISELYPEWKLEVFGKIDPDQQHIKLAKTLGLSDSVFFSPPIRDIQSKYLESSLYAMSSRSEGFGMVLIEAMACGLPCVSFDCPSGPKDIIDNNLNGFLVENGNINQFTEKLKTLIDDFELRCFMGKSARLKAKMYLPEVIMSEWHSLFTSILQNNNL
ncbi:glycosyltransferase family 4 protein [Mariniflexile sp.]|uniref:glycosyltransferase family 4 protein n=1 Tax=Mariniflexile sp. TaxID=1979402 RepID=UPI0040478DD7